MASPQSRPSSSLPRGLGTLRKLGDPSCALTVHRGPENQRHRVLKHSGTEVAAPTQAPLAPAPRRREAGPGGGASSGRGLGGGGT